MASFSLYSSVSLFTLPISVSVIIYSNLANAMKYIVEFQVNMKSKFTLFAFCNAWSELLAPLVNMIKEGCEN